MAPLDTERWSIIRVQANITMQATALFSLLLYTYMRRNIVTKPMGKRESLWKIALLLLKLAMNNSLTLYGDSVDVVIELELIFKSDVDTCAITNLNLCLSSFLASENIVISI